MMLRRRSRHPFCAGDSPLRCGAGVLRRGSAGAQVQGGGHRQGSVEKDIDAPADLVGFNMYRLGLGGEVLRCHEQLLTKRTVLGIVVQRIVIVIVVVSQVQVQVQHES